MFVDVLINHLQSIIKISCNIINLLSIFLNLVATKVNKLLQLHHKWFIKHFIVCYQWNTYWLGVNLLLFYHVLVMVIMKWVEIYRGLKLPT